MLLCSIQTTTGHRRQLTKTSTKPENGYEEVAGGVYKVPWQIDFDPKGRTDITDLFLYEDWVHGNSDGNTQHMWYSKDYLDLTLQEQGEDGEWTVICVLAICVPHCEQCFSAG